MNNLLIGSYHRRSPFISVVKKLIIVFLLLRSFGIIHAQKHVIIALPPGLSHPMAEVAIKVLPEIYSEIGYSVTFKTYPPERIDLMMDRGLIDGKLFVGDAFFAAHPLAVKVETPIGYDSIVVFSKEKDLIIEDWASLESYSIGYHIGMAVIGNEAEGFGLEPSQTLQQLFQKLEADRIDIAVSPMSAGLKTLGELGISDIYFVTPPLLEIPKVNS